MATTVTTAMPPVPLHSSLHHTLREPVMSGMHMVPLLQAHLTLIGIHRGLEHLVLPGHNLLGGRQVQ